MYGWMVSTDPFINLRILCITCDRHDRPVPKVAEPIPSQHLFGTICAQQHLTLNGCAVDWTPFEVPDSHLDDACVSLRRLTFLGLEPPPPAPVLDRILSSCHHLESLRIERSFPANVYPTFRLPNPSVLVDLQIQGSIETVSRILLWMMSTSAFVNLRNLRFSTRGLGDMNITPSDETLLPLVKRFPDVSSRS